MVQGYEFHSGPNLVIVVLLMISTQSRRVVCCEAFACRHCVGAERVYTRSCRLGTFHCILSRLGNAAFKISLNLTLIKSLD